MLSPFSLCMQNKLVLRDQECYLYGFGNIATVVYRTGISSSHDQYLMHYLSTLQLEAKQPSRTPNVVGSHCY
jgi:hypothetical protein